MKGKAGMQFEISWTETLNRCETLEAESLEEAFKSAKDKYFDGNINMDKNSFVGVEIVAVNQKTGEAMKDDFE